MRVLFVLIVLLSIQILHAQDSLLHWSEPVRISRSENFLGVTGADDSHFYTSGLNEDESRDLSIDRYDLPSLSRTSYLVSLPEENENRHEFVSVSRVKNGLLYFSQHKNKTSEQYQFFATALNTKGEKVLGPVLLHAIPISSFRSEGKFQVHFSPDSSMFLAFFSMPFERKAKETLDLKVYTLDFEMMWEKELELPYEDDVVQVRNFLIDNRGDVYMMSGWAPEKKFVLSKFQRPQDGRYVLFHYNWRENRLKEFDVSLKNKSIVSVIPRITPAGNVAIAGFFSNDYLFSVSGSFLFVVDPVTDVVKTGTMVALPKEFLGQFISKRAVERGLDLSDFYLDHFFIDENGEATLVGERFYITERVVTDPTTGRQTIDYIRNFDDIMMLGLKSDGSISWTARIPKRQTTFEQGELSSYAIFHSASGTKIYFNDDPDNTDLQQTTPDASAREYSNERNSIVTEVQVDLSGNFQRRSVSDNKLSGFSLRPSICGSPDGPVILGFEEGRNVRYAIMKSR